MSEAPIVIRRRDKADRALGFERLLAQGLQQLQQLGGKVWTDHNLHDPGITVLEQLCFALTELGYRAELPIADHLAGPDGQIDLGALALHPPEEVLPCRATTLGDYRRLFLDRVPGLDEAQLRPSEAPAWAGIYRLRLKVASGAPFAPSERDEQALGQARSRAVWRAYRAQRNLCEDLDPDSDLVVGWRHELVADIEIHGQRDAAEIVADTYHRAARWVDRGPRLHARTELLVEGRTMDQVYDGPAALVGFVEDPGADDPGSVRLYLADLVRELRGIEGIKEIHDLALVPAEAPRAGRSASVGGPSIQGSLLWASENWALQLHVPHAAEMPRVTLRRRSLEVPLPGADEIWRRVRNLRAADEALRKGQQDELRREERAARPRGTHLPAVKHHSVQHEFPALYALGKHALPPSATAQRRARVHQLRAYLLMFDQLLANGDAQLHHLRELFAVRGARAADHDAASPGDGCDVTGDGSASTDHRTYWWKTLEADGVPGLQELLTQPAGTMTSEIVAFFDRSSVRKSRLLDHLLALHGETLTQNALRQYCGHLRNDELDALLLDNKARFLEGIVELSRDRAGAFDDSRRLWGNRSNFSGLARRMCLLLGFKFEHAHPLTRSLDVALRRAGLALVEGEPAPRGDAPHGASEVMINVADAPAPSAAQAKEWPDPLRWLRRLGPRLPGELFRAAVGHDRYRMHTVQAASHGARTAMSALGDGGARWTIEEFQTRETARLAAGRLRRALMDLHDECEGLHVVEHVLLRPVRARSPEHLRVLRSGGFGFALQLSVVMPNWTVRTHQPAFQRLAEETLGLNLPVHLQAQPILWLDFTRMKQFEQDFEAWLALRRLWCRAPGPLRARVADNLDAAASKVIDWLLPGSSGGAARAAGRDLSGGSGPPAGSAAADASDAPRVTR